MRRGHPGHPGLGGWRNENPRHFRPRTGGNPHFRPPRGYGLLDQHRFPPPGSRPHRPLHPFKQRSGGNEHTRHDHQDRGNYRSEYRQNHYPRNYDGDHQPTEKQMYPLPHHNIRPLDSSYGNSYHKSSSNYYEGSSKQYHMNNMGDIDDRYIPPRDPFRQHAVNPWSSNSNADQFDDRHKSHRYDEHNKSHRYDASESSKLLHDYTGHRPPSNDHYGGNPTPVINNSESFNRSVDDTVNIIRKRLMNRSEPNSEPMENNYDQPAGNETVEKTKESSHNFQPEQAAKKRVHRQRHSDKSSSDTSFTKIKSKIVNQFLKMDKDKIHKLMDNPTSSSKFEYAIDSLITESQYSFNRHLRSVAEKSLHASSSVDFIQDDNNTIYEDTFMKQMQCILDPQDTILLEDIKPIVMAELSKALQLDEYEHRLEIGDEGNCQQRFEEPNYNDEYYDNLYNYDEFSQYAGIPDQKVDLKHTPANLEERPESVIEHHDNKSHESNESYFAKRSRQRSRNISPEKIKTPESPPHSRKSLDERLSELHFSSIIGESEPDNRLFDSKPEEDILFKANTEAPLEDEDYTFAELDKQYHVAVDHSYIENEEDISSLNLEKDSKQIKAPNIAPNISLNLNTLEKDTHIIKEEIDHQLQDMALSSIELPLYSTTQPKKTEETLVKSSSQPEKSQAVIMKNERKLSCDAIQTAQLINTSHIEKPTNSNESSESKKINKDTEKSDASLGATKCSVIFPSRKRSIDISPSHTKEKRRKSESVSHDSDKQSQHKHTIVNTHENSSKCSKKDDKRNFPEKHTKRKESHKKTDSKENESRKKISSTESPNCSLSPKESNSVINSNKVHNKTECKNTLKMFDIFSEQPKKVNLHQSHRNTALPLVDNSKTSSQAKNKPSNKVLKKHVHIQVEKKVMNKEIQTIEQRSTSTKFTQTDKRRLNVKATQTDAVLSITKKESSRSTDALERMKEIDMEIQALLQEKFKIYSSIESKETGTNSLHTLGMAVVNVSPTEDTIVDDFTNIPVEELEQIALESIEEKPADSKPETRNRRRALSKEKSKSQSPTPVIQKKNNKKGKTPNISLIEQIISDDRPIEDIISLDDLEETGKSRGRNIKSRRRFKRRGPLRSQSSTPTVEPTEYVLKDCAVLIVREDFSKYLATTSNVEEKDTPHSPPSPCPSVIRSQNDMPVEEVNDIQFDMLDVSEDIVIGDVCEVKSIEDKEDASHSEVQCISEEIILDNSQSSLEDQQGSTSDAKENECKMFDYSSDENLRQDSIIVTGNADAVLAIESIENNFLAACLDGNVYYFSGDGQLITTLRGSNLAVTCLTIVKEKYGTTVYTGSLDSRIRYYDLDTGLEKGPECNVLSPIQTMDRAWDTVFVGTRTGFVLQFECKNNMLIPVSTVQFSDQSILALRAMKEGPRKVLLVAARSEDVTIKDAQTGLLLRTLAGPKMTVYTLLYEDGKVYCGTSSSQIHVFDYSSGSHVGAHEGGKGAVCLRAAGGLVFAGCYDGCVYVYREGERRPFSQLRGPSLMLLSLAVVGTKIIAGYKDRSLYIWKIPLSILQEMIL